MPGTPMVEGEKRFREIVLWSPHIHALTTTSIKTSSLTNFLSTHMGSLASNDFLWPVFCLVILSEFTSLCLFSREMWAHHTCYHGCNNQLEVNSKNCSSQDSLPSPSFGFPVRSGRILQYFAIWESGDSPAGFTVGRKKQSMKRQEWSSVQPDFIVCGPDHFTLVTIKHSKCLGKSTQITMKSAQVHNNFRHVYIDIPY